MISMPIQRFRVPKNHKNESSKESSLSMDVCEEQHRLCRPGPNHRPIKDHQSCQRGAQKNYCTQSIPLIVQVTRHPAPTTAITILPAM
ncbi:hypothetical protein PGT21_024397 [Puccinia graminis f. sp. tritici]|uniref:Uncharacterized protein n=1 Tax=Puccinia graminis f. sp. tritici TaxID=56615 RepID=A0A5B0S1U8_PUCGR|nr:hypothetical protein PGT21_024397 [Puccinia graminis f. sp. tritici]KAA1131762.1 hypothetical protein PGTUg99_021554 [Puccinia graminis f. sp. tritici]